MGGSHYHGNDVSTSSYNNSTTTSMMTEDDTEFVSVPLTDTQRAIVIVVHFIVFVIGAVSIWAFLYKYDILRQRIWCPYLLLMGLIFFQIAGAFEIGNHYYEGNWELAGFPSDLVNGSFYFFNFGATYLNALGMRKKGVPIFRRPLLFRYCCCGGGSGSEGKRSGGCRTVINSLLDLLAMIFDLILVVGFLITGPMYFAVGRGDAVGILSGFAALAGFATLFRLWRNLGPNCGTLFGGLGWYIMIICGIALTSVYMETGYEWLHALLGSFFVLCLVPITVGILCATEDVVETDAEDSVSNNNNDKNNADDVDDDNEKDIESASSVEPTDKILENENNDDWNDLPDDAKKAAELLGYTKSLWDNDKIPTTCDKDWNDLSPPQKEAATNLGYNTKSWTDSIKAHSLLF